MPADLEIRKARPDERQTVLDVANAAFSRPDRKFDFQRLLPYCFTPGRMENHWLALEQGRVLGLIGVYPFTVRLAGVDFRSAGVGQVSTLPEARGKGVMSALLQAATAEMDQRYDFTWLWGDRQRYGRYGWAIGGQTLAFESFDKYLPSPPPADQVKPLDLGTDTDRLYAQAMQLPYAVRFSRDEFALLLQTPDIGGWSWRGGWVLCRPADQVLLAGGDESSVAGLLAHIACQRKSRNPDHWKVGFETAPCDSVLTRVARPHYWRAGVHTSASFRLCDMAGWFGRAATAVGTLPGGSDELSLRNTDNGQAVRLTCRDGRFTVSPQAGPDARELSTLDLSEALFGLLPLETTLPGLAPHSPLRALLRLPVHVSHLYSL